MASGVATIIICDKQLNIKFFPTLVQSFAWNYFIDKNAELKPDQHHWLQSSLPYTGIFGRGNFGKPYITIGYRSYKLKICSNFKPISQNTVPYIDNMDPMSIL